MIVFFSMMVGTISSALVVAVAVNDARKKSALLNMPRWAGFACQVIAALLFLPAWFAGIVVGGNFGAALADHVAESLNQNGVLLITVGIGLGIFVVTTLLSLIFPYGWIIGVGVVSKWRST